MNIAPQKPWEARADPVTGSGTLSVCFVVVVVAIDQATRTSSMSRSSVVPDVPQPLFAVSRTRKLVSLKSFRTQPWAPHAPVLELLPSV